MDLYPLLPADIRIRTFPFYLSVIDLLHWAQTCRESSLVVREKMIWTSLILRNFKFLYDGHYPRQIFEYLYRQPNDYYRQVARRSLLTMSPIVEPLLIQLPYPLMRDGIRLYGEKTYYYIEPKPDLELRIAYRSYLWLTIRNRGAYVSFKISTSTWWLQIQSLLPHYVSVMSGLEDRSPAMVVNLLSTPLFPIGDLNRSPFPDDYMFHGCKWSNGDGSFRAKIIIY